VWYREDALREREWGIEMDNMPDNERHERYARVMAQKDIEPYFWAPPGGESIAAVRWRLKSILDTLHRECTDKRVITVCHGEVMWALRVTLERMPEEKYKELHISKHPFNHIHNCQIIHYTRRNPETQDLATHLNWMRSVCPWDTTLSSNVWQQIIRPKWTNEQLREIVEKTPQLISE
jgi:NAD+ kinase